MHIKDHSAAMKFFRTYDNVASKGKWKEFVNEMEFDSVVQEPRTMAQGERPGFQSGQLVQPGPGRQGYGGEKANIKTWETNTGKKYDTQTTTNKWRIRKGELTGVGKGHGDYPGGYGERGGARNIGKPLPKNIKKFLRTTFPDQTFDFKPGQRYGVVKSDNPALHSKIQKAALNKIANPNYTYIGPSTSRSALIYEKGFGTGDAFVKKAQAKGINISNPNRVSIFAERFNVNSKANPFAGHGKIYDLTILDDPKKVEKIIKAQVAGGGATPESTEKYLSQDKRDIDRRIKTKKRREAIKKYSDYAIEAEYGVKKTKLNPTQLSHMDDIYSQYVTGETLGYAPAKINQEFLKPYDDKMKALYKKRDQLIKAKPKDLVQQLEKINLTGARLAGETGGYKSFKFLNPNTLKSYQFGVEASKTIDPLGLLEGKSIKEIENLSPENRYFFEKNRKAVLASQKKVNPTEITSLLQKFCGYGKSAGGRIGFSKGSCSPEVAQRNFLMATEDVAKKRVTGEAAEQIVKNAGKVVAKAGSKSALMSFLGPAGFGLDIAFEIGSIGTDMAMDSNVTLKGALQNNWLTGFFMKGTGQEEYHKGLFAKDSSAKPFGTAMDLYARIEQEEKNLKRMKTGSDRATTTEAMLNAQKQKIADLSSFFDKLARKEGGRFLALEKGSPEQVAYVRAKQEHDSIGAAKALLKRTSKAGFEKMIKEGAQKRGYSKYGYEKPEQYGDFTKNELDTILKKFAPDNPNVNPETYGFKDYSDLSTFISNYGKTQNVADFGGVANMAGGGRIGFSKGSVANEARRAFMKWLAGITGATIAGGTGLIKLGKGATKVVPQVTEEVIKRGADGTPLYIADLIKVVKAKGIKKIMDSNINKMPDTVHTYKNIDVIEDAAGDVTRIRKDIHYGSDNYMVNPEIHMSITKGKTQVTDEGLKTQKSFKEADEFEEISVTPDMDGKMKDADFYVDDQYHLEFEEIANEAKDLLKVKKASGGRVSYFDGGIVSLKKKW